MAQGGACSMVNCAIEPLSYMLLNGLVEMAFEAWQALEKEHRDVPYAPDWEAYQRQENENSLRFFALRDDAQLLGYASINIDTDIHRTGLLMACLKDIYITPGKRGHAPQFVRFIESVLSSLGVRRITAAERLNSPDGIGKFYEAMNFQPQEIIWAKTLNSTVH